MQDMQVSKCFRVNAYGRRRGRLPRAVAALVAVLVVSGAAPGQNDDGKATPAPAGTGEAKARSETQETSGYIPDLSKYDQATLRTLAAQLARNIEALERKVETARLENQALRERLRAAIDGSTPGGAPGGAPGATPGATGADAGSGKTTPGDKPPVSDGVESPAEVKPPAVYDSIEKALLALPAELRPDRAGSYSDPLRLRKANFWYSREMHDATITVTGRLSAPASHRPDSKRASLDVLCPVRGMPGFASVRLHFTLDTGTQKYLLLRTGQEVSLRGVVRTFEFDPPGHEGRFLTVDMTLLGDAGPAGDKAAPTGGPAGGVDGAAGGTGRKEGGT